MLSACFLPGLQHATPVQCCPLLQKALATPCASAGLTNGQQDVSVITSIDALIEMLPCTRRAAEAEKRPFVGIVEPLSALEEGDSVHPNAITTNDYFNADRQHLGTPNPCVPHSSSMVDCVHATGAEYRQGSAVFRDKIRSLEMQYGSMRRTRGDGNCFFRSFMFAFMEQLVQNNDIPERNRCALAPLMLFRADG